MPDNFLLLFFPLAITLHNIEEALWLPQWSRHAARFHPPVEAKEFHFALIIITALAYLITFLTLAFPHIVFIKWIFYGFLGVMVINAIFPHLIATIALKRYAPGLLTGIFLMLPIDSLLIYRAINAQIITGTQIIIATLLVGVVLIMIIPLLLKTGHKLLDY